MIKMIVVLALAAIAMAEPEADADAYYGTYYGYGAPYARYGGYGYGYRSYGYGYPAYGYYGKREAEAEPEAEAEADPALLYTTGVHAYAPYTHQVATPLVHSAVKTVVQTPAVTSVSSPLVRTLLPATTYTTPLVHSAPVVHSAVKTYVNTAPVVHSTPLVGYSAVQTPYVRTLGLTHPVTSINNVPVTHTVVKREAEAEPEADPALLYTTGVHAPLAYTHQVAHVAAPAVAYTHAAPTVTYTHAAAPAVAYTVPVAKAVSPVVQYVAAPSVVKAADHGVAATYAGLVHSSHVGVCVNNMGAQVPC